MSTIDSQHDLSGTIEHVIGACSELAAKSGAIEAAVASFDATGSALLDALAQAFVRRTHAIQEFASFQETARHDYQTIEHRSTESLKKISQTIDIERSTLAAAMDTVHSGFVEIAKWTSSARDELSHLEKTISDNSTGLIHISEEVAHAYLGVYTSISRAEGDVIDTMNHCRTVLAEATHQMGSHCSQLESAIQQSAEALSHAVGEQATAFGTNLQQLTEQELSPGITNALDLAQRGLQENVKAVIEQAAGEVNSSVQEGRSRADSHRQNVLNAFLPPIVTLKSLMMCLSRWGTSLIASVTWREVWDF